MRRLLDRYVLDNPLVVRELIERLGGGKLASGIFIATVMQAGAAAIGFLVFVYEQPPGVENSLPLMIYVGWSGALLTFVALSAPLRALGLFDWERRKQSLDQHVTSGSSPIVCLRGKLTISGLYALEILLASLPLGLLPVFLGDFSIWWMVEQMIVAGAFGFMLIGLVLWGSVIEPELGVAFAVGCVGALALILGGPMPELMPELSVLMPTHACWTHVAAAASTTTAQQIVPRMFGHEVPGGGMLTAGIYVVIGLLGILAAVAGPRPLFGPQAATFGTLISERKRSWRRWVGTMMSRRRSDLRFLYENRPAWLREREGDLRELQSTVVALLLIVVTMGLLWPPLTSWSTRDQASLTVTILCLYTIAIAARGVASRDELAVPGRYARSTVFYAGLALLLVAPLAIFEFGLVVQPAGATGRAAPDENLWKIIPLISVHGLVLFLLGRGASWHSRGRMRGWAFQFMAAAALHAGAPMAFMAGTRVGAWGSEMAWLARVSAFYSIGATLWGDGEISYRKPIGEGVTESVDLPLNLPEVYLFAGAMVAALLVLNAFSGWRAGRRARRAATTSSSALFAVGILVMALAAGTACAQGGGEPPPEVRDPAIPDLVLEVGFETIYLDVSRMPVTVRITGGSASFRGRVELSSPEGERLWASGALDLEPGEARVFRMVLSPRDGLTGLAGDVFRDGTAERIWRVEAGAMLYQRSRAVVLVDASRAGRALSMNQMGDQTYLGAAPDQLPEEGRGYAGITTIVVGRIAPGVLEQGQIDALREFVLGGGSLVLGSGNRIGPRVTAFADELFPALADPRSEGARPATFMQLVDEKGADHPAEMMGLQRTLDLGGRLLLGDAEHPEAVSFRMGRGRLIVLAFDPWAAPVAGSLSCELLINMLQARPQEWSEVGVSGRLDSLRSTEGGVLLVLCIVLVVPLLCAIVPYLIARLRKQPLLTWFYAPAGAVAAILAVAVLATRSGDSLAAADTMTWWPRGGGSPAARFVEVAVASRGREQVHLELRENWRELEVIRRRSRWEWRSEGHLVGVAEGAGGTTEVRGLEVGRWQSKGLRGVRGVDEPAPFEVVLRVSGNASGTPASMALEFHGLELDLQDVVVTSPFASGSVAAEIQAGTPVVADWELSRWSGLRPALHKGLSSSDWRVVSDLYERFAGDSAAPSQRGSPECDPRLCARIAREEDGWLGESPGMREVRGVDLIALPLRVVVEPGSSLWVPTEFVGKHHLGTWELSTEEEVAAGAPHRLSVYTELAVPTPDEPGDFEIESITFQQATVGFPRWAGIVGQVTSTEAYDWRAGKWVDVVAGVPTRSGEALAALLHPRTNRIMIRLTWTAPAGGRLPTDGLEAVEVVKELKIRGVR